jgi:hypothetical protein
MDKQLYEILKNQQRLMEVMATKDQKAAGSVNTATLLHGPGGIFSTPVERDVITAHVRPHGIGSSLRKIPTNTSNPQFPALTGYTAASGTEPTNACDDAPTTFVKSCNLTAQFGLLRRDTQTIEMDQVILKLNRGDFTDLRLIGEVLGLTEGMSPGGLNTDMILNNVVMSEMVGVGVMTERELNTRYWQGTVAAGQMPGLDSQIATGQVDANTNTACPSLDSDVKDFNYNDVCGTTLDIVEYVSMMAWYLQYNAVTMGLDPVDWIIAMRPELWYELTACWPCKYLTNRCLTPNVGANVAVINDNVNVSERDRMRNSMVLPINGIDYPVVTDTGIYEANSTNDANLAAGQFASSIYFVPRSINGGFPATRIEYLDYRLMDAGTRLIPSDTHFWWTDGGMFSWALEHNKWCIKLALKTEQRVVLQAPHLAGKIQNVRYTPLQHLRDPDPDSSYHYDGGISIRPSDSLYAVWS